MTEQIKSAISEIENMRKFNYTLAPNEVFDLAIRSLQAWSEVLQELEKKNALYMSYLSNKENPYDSDLFGKHIAVENCIDIIKQKLSEIEEVR